MGNSKGIVIKEKTLWRKVESAILAYFAENNNKPATYRTISRAYVSSSYSNYQKACEELVNRGWLKKLSDGKFKVSTPDWPQVSKGIEGYIERKIPYFEVYRKRVRGKKLRFI